jgi:hypothetical protein
MRPRPAQDRLRSVCRSASPGRPLSERSARRFQPAQHHAALVLVLLAASRLGVGASDTCIAGGVTLSDATYSAVTYEGTKYTKSAGEWGKCPTTPAALVKYEGSLHICAGLCKNYKAGCKSFEWQDNNDCECKLFGTAVAGTKSGPHHWCFRETATLAPTRAPTSRYRPSVCEVPYPAASW